MSAEKGKVTTEIKGRSIYFMLAGKEIGSASRYGHNVIIDGRVYSKSKAAKHFATLDKKAAAHV